MRFRFTLAALLLFTLLLAIELAALRGLSPKFEPYLWFAIWSSVVIATWGAVFSYGVRRRFARGYATLIWSLMLFGFLNFFNGSGSQKSRQMNRPTYFVTVAYEWIGRSYSLYQKYPPGSSDDPDGDIFYEIWKSFTLLNVGLIGGIAAVAAQSSPKRDNEPNPANGTSS